MSHSSPHLWKYRSRVNQAVKTAREAELNCWAVHSVPRMTGSTMQTEVRYMVHSTTLIPSARYCVVEMGGEMW